MTIDKDNTPTPDSEIKFNWEQIKKKAASTREQLISNSPKVAVREAVIEVPAPPQYEVNNPEQYPNEKSAELENMHRDNTIDLSDDGSEYVDPNDTSNAGLLASTPTPKSAESESIYDRPIDQDNIQYHASTPTSKSATQEIIHTQPPHIDKGHMEKELSGTLLPSLLAGAPAGAPLTSHSQLVSDASSETVMDEALGPEKNAVEILRGIKEKSFTGRDITMDERRLVVKSLRELGQTQDSIAEVLKVSRRTIVSDCRALQEEAVLAIASKQTEDIAGEVYSVARTCIRRALAAGSFRTVSTVLRDMVETLQSLGIVYRAPKTSMQAQWHGKIQGSNSGYRKYVETIGDDKDKLVEVLDCMFTAIDTDNI